MSHQHPLSQGRWICFTQPSSVPALYQKYSTNPVAPEDEWALSEAMRADVAGGGIGQMEEHYKTFIVSPCIFGDSAGFAVCDRETRMACLVPLTADHLF